MRSTDHSGIAQTVGHSSAEVETPDLTGVMRESLGPQARAVRAVWRRRCGQGFDKGKTKHVQGGLWAAGRTLYGVV